LCKQIINKYLSDGEISIKGRSHVEDEEGEDLFKEKEDRDMELLE